MLDLNDLYYFHAVVFHNGFSAASRIIGVPKGTLSKRVARLEERLQVQLLVRSTRKLRTTDVGRAFFEHCQSMLAEVEAAESVAVQASADVSGVVRVSCPQGLTQSFLADLLPGFIERYPGVCLVFRVINRPADLIDDRVDVMLRVRIQLDSNPTLVIRKLGVSQLILVMSPKLHAECGFPISIDSLSRLPAITMEEASEVCFWDLRNDRGEKVRVPLKPRLMCSNFDMLLAATLKGAGVALLPDHICRKPLADGELIHVLPEWHTEPGCIHALFSSRKGMVPAVRAFVDYLVSEVPGYTRADD